MTTSAAATVGVLKEFRSRRRKGEDQRKSVEPLLCLLDHLGLVT